MNKIIISLLSLMTYTYASVFAASCSSDRSLDERRVALAAPARARGLTIPSVENLLGDTRGLHPSILKRRRNTPLKHKLAPQIKLLCREWTGKVPKKATHFTFPQLEFAEIYKILLDRVAMRMLSSTTQTDPLIITLPNHTTDKAAHLFIISSIYPIIQRVYASFNKPSQRHILIHYCKADIAVDQLIQSLEDVRLVSDDSSDSDVDDIAASLGGFGWNNTDELDSTESDHSDEDDFIPQSGRNLFL